MEQQDQPDLGPLSDLLRDSGLQDAKNVLLGKIRGRLDDLTLKRYRKMGTEELRMSFLGFLEFGFAAGVNAFVEKHGGTDVVIDDPEVAADKIAEREATNV